MYGRSRSKEGTNERLEGYSANELQNRGPDQDVIKDVQNIL